MQVEALPAAMKHPEKKERTAAAKPLSIQVYLPSAIKSRARIYHSSYTTHLSGKTVIAHFCGVVFCYLRPGSRQVCVCPALMASGSGLALTCNLPMNMQQWICAFVLYIASATSAGMCSDLGSTPLTYPAGEAFSAP